MTFYVDYATEEGGDIIKEEFAEIAQAEKRARYLSRKLHSVGYDGQIVYVYRKFSPNGQRSFFAGRIDHTDNGYIADAKDSVSA